MKTAKVVISKSSKTRRNVLISTSFADTLYSEQTINEASRLVEKLRADGFTVEVEHCEA